MGEDGSIEIPGKRAKRSFSARKKQFSEIPINRKAEGIRLDLMGKVGNCRLEKKKSRASQIFVRDQKSESGGLNKGANQVANLKIVE